MEKQGVFYAVSVGPGDPELLTRQACRVLTDCGVVAAPPDEVRADAGAGHRRRCCGYAGQDHIAVGFHHGA